MGADRARRASFDQIRIASWAEFKHKVLSKKYANWVFRGHIDDEWTLEATLARRFRNARVDRRAWQNQEDRILSVFQRKAHLFLDHVPREDDILQWLAIMQHHGAPTRLLDFTYSPYVAAFFAFEGASKDAAIWALNHPALSRPYQLTVGGRRQVIDPDQWRLSANPARFKDYSSNEWPLIVWDNPYIMNQRLIAQSGLFIIPGSIAEPVEQTLLRHPQPHNMIVKFSLATDRLREEAMFELYRMNITHYTLFPGLDGLARSMGYEAEFHRSYNPRTMCAKPGWRERDLKN